MSNYFIGELCDRNRSMLSLEKGLNLYHLLQRSLLLGVEGEVVELGSYRGLTAVLLQETLRQAQSAKQLHIYDSFQGLPEKSIEDQLDTRFPTRKCDIQDNRRVGKGWFASPRATLEQSFQDYGLPLPHIHEGWFNETLANGLPDRLSFIHLDADFYTSTLLALKELYPRMSPGALLVIDDYCDMDVHSRQNSLPGVKRACDFFFSDKEEKVEVLAAGKEYQAVCIKN